MQPVVLDIGVASLIHKRKLPGPLAARLVGRRPVLTFITLGELTQWVHIRRWGSRSRQEFADNVKDYRDFVDHHGLRLITDE